MSAGCASLVELLAAEALVPARQERQDASEIVERSLKPATPRLVQSPLVAQPRADAPGYVGIEHHQVDPLDLLAAEASGERRAQMLIPQPLTLV